MRSITSATGIPSQPRMIPDRATIPLSMLTGAGSAIPTASTSPRLASTEPSMSAINRAARLNSLSARWSFASGMWRSATMVCATSDSATRRWRVE